MLFMLAMLSLSAQAAQSARTLEHKDWEVACDNTLTCRIAGYGKEEDPSGSILLTRDAGPGIEPTGEVTLGDTEDDSEPAEKLTLWIDGKPAGDLLAADDNWQMSASQTSAVIKAVKGSGKVEFKGGSKPFMLSNEGAYAVLLKADDVQGRIGTPGALTKKGNKPESSVAKAVPAPVIQAAKTLSGEPRLLTDPEIAALKTRLLPTVNRNDDDTCDSLFTSAENIDPETDGPTLTPLDDSHALLSALCWRAAYNEGYGYWVIDNQLKGQPVLVTVSGSDYDKGEITSVQKGRGIGDCMSQESWVWDGQAFRKSYDGGTGMCRYIHAGGTWDLPTFVTDVKPVSG
ncbi:MULTISPECIES: DUF1176 domain-containing protein [unclassified Pantoea]|jgi:hypothetical protein|uniref:DUF1176 domain-containing protein n=1 Tax=unclassified Pantoea TaxID=2630326 RepID=UPI0001E0DF7C|nr:MULTISPECIES: DUF1176 domain-containing protein [unclassified Pantoea]EFM20297.1 protein of unknown function DUF1176 [Pantoea sp. aB]QNQ60607.1 DUF1176 domain-containing protein [Pantoea sp. MT58]